MALRSGLASQFAVSAESTVGTRVAPAKFSPLVSESLTVARERLESAGIFPGRQLLRSEQWNGGPTTIAGDINLELYQAGLGVLLKHTLGANTTTGAGPYSHAMELGDLYGLGLTVGIGRPDNSGTVRYYEYAGCKVGSAEFAVEEGQIATASFSLMGMTESLAQSLPSASYATDKGKPYKYNHATVEFSGGARKVKSCTIAIDNALEERRFLGQTTTDEPISTGLREITVDLVVEHAGFTDYNLIVNGTEVAFEVALASGTNSLTFAGNARVDGTNAVVEGKGILLQPLTLKVVADGTDAAAFTAVMVNSESAI